MSISFTYSMNIKVTLSALRTFLSGGSLPYFFVDFIPRRTLLFKKSARSARALSAAKTYLIYLVTCKNDVPTCHPRERMYCMYVEENLGSLAPVLNNSPPRKSLHKFFDAWLRSIYMYIVLVPLGGRHITKKDSFAKRCPIKLVEKRNIWTYIVCGRSLDFSLSIFSRCTIRTYYMA